MVNPRKCLFSNFLFLSVPLNFTNFETFSRTVPFFRDNSSLIGWVKEIAESITHDGMIDGLCDLNELGLENRELLRKIGFDLKLLDMAVKKSRELARNKKAASFYSEDYLEVKKIRDQAYTHLKEAVDLIYDCGKYVFCENSARLKGYSSNHLRMKRMRWKRIHNVPGPEPGTEKLSIDI